MNPASKPVGAGEGSAVRDALFKCPHCARRFVAYQRQVVHVQQEHFKMRGISGSGSGSRVVGRGLSAGMTAGPCPPRPAMTQACALPDDDTSCELSGLRDPSAAQGDESKTLMHAQSGTDEPEAMATLVRPQAATRLGKPFRCWRPGCDAVFRDPTARKVHALSDVVHGAPWNSEEAAAAISELLEAEYEKINKRFGAPGVSRQNPDQDP
ncbi:MAG: hypothetical protein OXC07_01865 [Kistimonas sp.]|nr:hypothetical protein [Kistimonas sp.]